MTDEPTSCSWQTMWVVRRGSQVHTRPERHMQVTVLFVPAAGDRKVPINHLAVEAHGWYATSLGLQYHTFCLANLVVAQCETLSIQPCLRVCKQLETRSEQKKDSACRLY